MLGKRRDPEHSADEDAPARARVRALMENRDAADAAEAREWSRNAIERIQGGKVSGSSEFMRQKIGELRKS
jgi:hypothetical protein